MDGIQMQPRNNRPLGVEVSVLRKLLNEAEKQSLPSPLTTKWICDHVVMPATAHRSCAYIELLHGQTTSRGRPLLAPATVFVSHAWLYDFAMVVQVLEDIAASNTNTYFWFDLVLNNQHGTAERSFDWWSTTFRQSIEQIGRVALILTPWEDPVPLTRAWCLWEMFCAATGNGVKFDVFLPASEKAKLKSALVDDYHAVMNSLVRVQVERATAFKLDDQENIFKAVRESCGVAHLNYTVKNKLRWWLLHTVVDIARGVLDSRENTMNMARLLDNVGATLCSFGDLKHAQRFLTKAFNIKRSLQNVDDLIPTYLNLAQLYELQNRPRKSLEMCARSLQTVHRLRGEASIDTTAIYKRMATSYKLLGNDSASQQCLEKALHIALAAVGEQHPHVADIYDSMASTYQAKEDFLKAEELCKKSLDIRLATEGANHPNTAQTYVALATLYYFQQQHEKEKKDETRDKIRERENQTRALDYLEKALAIRLATVGSDHPDTAETYSAFAQNYMIFDNPDTARVYVQKALDIRRDTQSELGPGVAETFELLGLLHELDNQHLLSARAYLNATRIYARSLGKQHDKTIRTRRWATIIFPNICTCGVCGDNLQDHSEGHPLCDSICRCCVNRCPDFYEKHPFCYGCCCASCLCPSLCPWFCCSSVASFCAMFPYALLHRLGCPVPNLCKTSDIDDDLWSLTCDLWWCIVQVPCYYDMEVCLGSD